MNKEEFKKLAEEEFINNTMKHLDSALIFTYIQNLEKKAEQGEHYKHLYSELKKQKDDVVEYIKKYLHEHIIDDLPDEESKFETENGIPIPNAKEILLRMLGEIDVED